MFADVVTIKVHAGKGGNGLTSWRREKFVARGGPDGGDGGTGGSVILVADHNLDTLAQFRHTPLLRAEAGENGKHQKMHGKNGEDNIVRVPVGTVVWEGDNQVIDLTKAGQEAVVAQGGRGGFGNAHFTSSVRQAPKVSEVGEAGEEKELRLELKLIADVGLVGLPNAGKSTLLSVISNAKPEIADYPFTTLVPNLGVADIDQHSLLVADIPGLVEGASKGKGLGDEFLRHIERTGVLMHLVDATLPSVTKAYRTIRKELKEYSPTLSRKPQIVVLTKLDAVDEDSAVLKLREIKKLTKATIFIVSAVAHKNLHKLLREAYKMVKHERTRQKSLKRKKVAPTITLADDPNAWWIEKKRERLIIKGTKLEGFAKRTDFKSEAGMSRLRDIFHKQGVDRELVRLGVRIGDKVEIAGKSFQW